MKNLATKLVLMCLGLFLFASCEKDAELTTLEVVSFPATPEVSSSSLVLLQDTENEAALTISWQEVIFPVDAPVEYSLQFDVPGNTVGDNAWENAITLEAGTDVYSKSFKGIDLNQLAEELELEPDMEGKMVVRVLAYMDRSIASEPVTLTITPYETVIDIQEIFLPGGYQGWDPSTAVSLPTTEVNGIFRGILTLPEGNLDFKITIQRNWEDNYGDDDNGNLVFDSPNNLSVPAAGTYEITVNLNTMRWSAEPYSFGIIGTATPGGWDVDTNMSYNNANNQWEFSGYLQPGALKFRLNDSWSVNYGSRNNDEGIAYLDDPGAHTITEAGVYDVTFRIDPNDPSLAYYTVEKVSWGIVGDATAGGWDTDTDMTYDPEAGLWKVTAELTPGAFKFRRNDSWTINYGPRNNDDGILYLDDPGAHGISEAGTYEITFSLDPANPGTATYTVQKTE